MSWGMPAILSQSNVLTKQTANYLVNGKLKLHNNMDTDGCCCCSAIRSAAHARPSLICCQTQQPRIEWNKPLYMAFIDQEKAFDRVVRAELWKSLAERGIFGELLRAVHSLYICSQAAVRTREGETDWFEVKCGLRQGCVLSPLLFIIFLDNIHVNLTEAKWLSFFNRPRTCALTGCTACAAHSLTAVAHLNRTPRVNHSVDRVTNICEAFSEMYVARFMIRC